jgi:mannose-6-phosphate isomerase-like protein (cupin superfamily)
VTGVEKYSPVNISEKLSRLKDYWKPRIVAEMNDYQFKIVKLEGDFIWHHHSESDETFIVIEGYLRINFRDGSVDLGPGEMFVVPKGVEHKPFAEHEVKLLLVEPRGVTNTGEGVNERTAQNDLWI